MERNLWNDTEHALAWLNDQIEERFPDYRFRFGMEKEFHRDGVVVLVQYTKVTARLFDRIGYDATVEVFRIHTQEELVGLRDKIITRLMLLGLNDD